MAEIRESKFPVFNGNFSLDLPVKQVHSLEEALNILPTAKEPLIWKAGLRGTQLEHWNLHYLKKNAGETPVKILGLSGLNPDHSKYTDQVMPFKAYIRLMKNQQVYLRFSDLLDNCANLRDDLPIEMLRRLSGNPSRINLQFFLGGPRAGTPLHAELNYNIFMQVFGSKRWVLFPVSATERLGVPAAGRFYFFSPLDPLKPPRIKTSTAKLQGWEIILDRGDILLCPPFLWHAVENLTTSCSIGFKYNRLWQAMRISPLLFAMNLFARNPSYPTYIWHAFVRKRHPILATK